MKIEEIRKKSNKELHKLLAEKREELREVRFKVAARQHKNYKQIGKLRKDISQVMTIIKEKLLLNNTSKEESK